MVQMEHNKVHGTKTLSDRGCPAVQVLFWNGHSQAILVKKRFYAATDSMAEWKGSINFLAGILIESTKSFLSSGISSTKRKEKKVMERKDMS